MWLSPDGSEIVYQSAVDARFEFRYVVTGSLVRSRLLGDLRHYLLHGWGA